MDVGKFSNFTLETSATKFFKRKGVLQRQLSKGYKFYAEKYIHNVSISASDLCVTAKCYRSQKKNDKALSLTLICAEEYDDEGSKNIVIVEAHCSCEAGNSQSCNHIVGLAYYVQDFIFRGGINLEDNGSRTSQPMKWNVPRGNKILPEKISKLHFQDPLNVTRKRAPVQSTLKNPLRNPFQASMEEMLLLRKQIGAINGNIGASYLLCEGGEEQIALPPPLAGEFIAANSFLGNIYRMSEPAVASTINLSTLSFEPHLPLIENDEITNILRSLEPFPQLKAITLQECNALEKATRGQASSNTWLKERKNRFTASRFGEIYKRKLINDKFKQNLLTSKKISDLPNVRHGIDNEDVAVRKYLEIKKYNFCKPGLIVHPNALFLGATPDGILYDKQEGYGILEVKCLNSKKYGNINEALNLKVKNFCIRLDENNLPVLNEKHDYFYQVQGQMLISGITWADFVVYLTENEIRSEEIIIIRVNFDPIFCRKMCKKLREIYKIVYFP